MATLTSTEIILRRRSISEGCKIEALANFMEDDELPIDHIVPVLLPMTQCGGESAAVLEQRSKSEDFIRTAQGIVFPDTKCHQYQTRLDTLLELAANASSSQSNVLLAKKALRYRKVLERRRIMQ
ncbi:hypothetical protein PHYBOEH_006361 [Phytophthora boehmeriae]|uniref:Uncharacterized protein n=1 Tax=Phytophthora boehmeriae TaxID=109152 RepID=A0A8T1WGA4_9STRA|nr:hypothetical protein PHYBOEH_006361 [Phytophthora boehmeriae]